MKPHLLTRKIVKPHYVTMVLRMFLKLLKSQSIMVIFYTKKTRINDYMDRKYYFDKYFEMGTILTIFFLQTDYFGLKLSKTCSRKKKIWFFFSPKRKIPKNMLFPASYPWKDTSQKSPPKMGVYNMLYHLKLRINWLKRWKHSKIPFNIFIIYMCILKEMVTFTKNK